MTSVYLVISIFIPILIGFSFVRACIPAGRYWCRHDCLRLALGIGVGFGICSCSLFLWLLAYGSIRPLYIIVEISLAAIFAGISVRRCTGCCLCKTFGEQESPPVRSTNPLFIAFWALFLFACLSFSLRSRIYPEGQLDAWAIWNLRARFLFRGGDQWRTAFSNKLPWSHPDYPLLLPATVVRTWAYTGSEDIEAPVEIAMLFTIATVGVLTAGLWTITGREKAFLAGVALLGTASFIMLGASQGADVPISFFFLATLVLLFLEDRLPISVTVLAGTTAALAVWTKNEGIPFFVLFIIARKLAKRPMSAFLIGASWVFVLHTIFKLSLAPANYLFRQEWKQVLTDVSDPSRYLLIIVGFIYQVAKFGGQGPNPLIPLAAAFILIGRKGRPGSRTALLTLAGVCGGVFVTYLLTPFDLSWHIGSSLDRLLLQLWPAALFTCFLVLELPAMPISAPDFLHAGMRRITGQSPAASLKAPELR
jgi:hypothetical protein